MIQDVKNILSGLGDDQGHKFEVRLGQTIIKCAINLMEQTYSCRFWQLTGMQLFLFESVATQGVFFLTQIIILCTLCF